MNVEHIVTILAVVFAGFGLLLNWAAIVSNTRSSKAQKQVDVIIECNNRYMKAASDLKIAISNDVSKFNSQDIFGREASKFGDLWRNYWSVYYEEWQYYQIGMVPLPFYKMWCMGLVRNFSRGEDEGFLGIELWEMWEKYGAKSWGYSENFESLVVELFRISKLSKENRNAELDRALSKVNYTRKSTRKRFGL